MPWSKVAVLGIVIPPLIGNPYNRYINHCTLISFTILIPASQPVWPAGRFRVIWPAGRFGVIWPAGRFGVIWPAGRFRRIWPAGRFRKIWPAGRFRNIWPAGRFRKIWPAAGFCSKRSASVHTLCMSKTCNGLVRYILYTCPNLM